MAKDSSFDVVSQVDMQEVDNAYQQCVREIAQRYDLNDQVRASSSEGDAPLHRVTPRPTSSPVRSSMSSTPASSSAASTSLPMNWDAPPGCIRWKRRVAGRIVEGIDQPTAKKKINRDIKDLKAKV